MEDNILKLLETFEPSLTLSGGIILFLIVINIIFPPPRGHYEESVLGEPFIVPFDISYIAGPSAMAALILLMCRKSQRWSEWLFALVLSWSISGVIMFLSNGLSRIFGKRRLIAIEKLMGMLLTTISVQVNNWYSSVLKNLLKIPTHCLRVFYFLLSQFRLK